MVQVAVIPGAMFILLQRLVKSGVVFEVRDDDFLYVLNETCYRFNIIINLQDLLAH